MSLNIKAQEFIPDSKSSFEAYVHNMFSDIQMKLRTTVTALTMYGEEIEQLKNENKKLRNELKFQEERIDDITPPCYKCNGTGEYSTTIIGECGNTIKDWKTCDCQFGKTT